LGGKEGRRKGEGQDAGKHPYPHCHTFQYHESPPALEKRMSGRQRGKGKKNMQSRKRRENEKVTGHQVPRLLSSIRNTNLNDHVDGKEEIGGKGKTIKKKGREQKPT